MQPSSATSPASTCTDRTPPRVGTHQPYMYMSNLPIISEKCSENTLSMMETKDSQLDEPQSPQSNVRTVGTVSPTELKIITPPIEMCPDGREPDSGIDTIGTLEASRRRLRQPSAARLHEAIWRIALASDADPRAAMCPDFAGGANSPERDTHGYISCHRPPHTRKVITSIAEICANSSDARALVTSAFAASTAAANHCGKRPPSWLEYLPNAHDTADGSSSTAPQPRGNRSQGDRVPCRHLGLGDRVPRRHGARCRSGQSNLSPHLRGHGCSPRRTDHGDRLSSQLRVDRDINLGP